MASKGLEGFKWTSAGRGEWIYRRQGDYEVLARIIPLSAKVGGAVRLALHREAFGDTVVRYYAGDYPTTTAAKKATMTAIAAAQTGTVNGAQGPHVRRSKTARRAGSRRTYKQAQQDVMQALAAEGWNVSTYGPRGPLKFPHAISADGDHQIWFKAQAIYHGKHGAGMNEARSMWLGDIRHEPVAKVVAEINRQVVSARF